MRERRDAPAGTAPAAKAPAGTARQRACPVCGKPAAHEHRPFCSRRCADVDLHRWLGERYVIPGREDEAASEKREEGEE